MTTVRLSPSGPNVTIAPGVAALENNSQTSADFTINQNNWTDLPNPLSLALPAAEGARKALIAANYVLKGADVTPATLDLKLVLVEPDNTPWDISGTFTTLRNLRLDPNLPDQQVGVVGLVDVPAGAGTYTIKGQAKVDTGEVQLVAATVRPLALVLA